MKICAVICEYNPFHDGHKYQLDLIKKTTTCDLIVALMSGNFTQRGEIAVLDKYTRAIHAIKGGADIVLELPTVFATSTAEIFAKGAIKLLSTLNGDITLCFGVESGDKQEYLATAKILSEETKEFSTLLKAEMDNGSSFAKARVDALSKMDIKDINLELLSSPNNILGVEYTKAILESNAKIDILPLVRVGADYNDGKAYPKLSSAKGIREMIASGKKLTAKKNVPDFVYKDLPKTLPNINDILLYSVINSSVKDLSYVFGVNEGLENRIKALSKDCYYADELIDKLTTKRYTKSRVTRILTANILGITEKFLRKCLKSKLYIKVLAVKNTTTLSKIKNDKTYPLITRKSDVKKLTPTAIDCFELDVKANDVYNLVTKNHTNEYDMKIIK